MVNVSSKNNLYRLAGFFSPYKVKVFFATLSLLLTAVCILLYGSTAKIFIDEGFLSQSGSRIDLFFANFVFLTVLLAIAGYFRSYLINKVALDVASDLKKKVFAKCLNFPMSYFDNNGSGDIISRINSDVSDLFATFTKNISFFLRNVVLFIGGVVFLVILSVKLFTVMILTILLSFIPIMILVRKMKPYSSLSKEINSDLSSFMKESFSFIMAIKSFNAQVRTRHDFDSISEKFLANEKLKSATQSLIVAVSIFFAFFAVALILYLGALDVLGGVMSGGDLSSFVFYAVILSVSLVGIMQSISQIMSISQSSKRVFELLDGQGEDYESGLDLNLVNDYVIEFKDVDFSYPGKKEQKILDKLSFKIKKGQKIAIRGKSGSGKSSIFNILLRFYDIDSGEVLINDNSIKSYSLISLRRIFSYVMQDNFIFSGTIYDNIIYPNNNIDKEDLARIISSYEALSFINDLPDGIESNIGDVGSKLSGGQKQRISILRSILSDCEVLIFDEATSALDNENENAMLDLIESYAKDKTIIFVSHRSNDKLKFDQIIEIG